MALPALRRPRRPRRRPPIGSEVEEGLLLIGFTARMRLKNRIVVDVLTMDGAVDPSAWTAEARRLLRELARQAADAAGRTGQEEHVSRYSSGRGESEHDYRAVDARNLRRRTLIQQAVADGLAAWEADPVQVAVLVDEARTAGLDEIAAAVRRLVVEERTATPEDEAMMQQRIALVRDVDVPALGRRARPAGAEGSASL